MMGEKEKKLIRGCCLYPSLVSRTMGAVKRDAVRMAEIYQIKVPRAKKYVWLMVLVPVLLLTAVFLPEYAASKSASNLDRERAAAVVHEIRDALESECAIIIMDDPAEEYRESGYHVLGQLNAREHKDHSNISLYVGNDGLIREVNYVLSIDIQATKEDNQNQVLFSKNSEYMQDLIMLFETQSHRVMALWAFEFASESIAKLEEKYPEEKRPREALEAAQDWASGKIKMRLAQRKILDCHAFAKEIEDKEDIAICHSIGQACAVVHTAGHAIGYPIYDLTAIIYKYGIENCKDAVEQRKQEYIEKVLYWNEHLCDYQGTWADFMLK